MIVNLNINAHYCEVIRESDDIVFSGICNAAGESRLLYHVKKILNNRGYDLIKKRMAKDGHLVSDTQQYLRTRKPSGDPKKNLCIYNTEWCINGADFYFRKNGRVLLRVETGIFK